MKKFDVALRIAIDAPNDWDKLKVEQFIASVFDLVESPLGTMKAEVIDVKQAYVDIRVIGGKK